MDSFLCKPRNSPQSNTKSVFLFIMSSFTIFIPFLRHGLRGRELMSMVGKTMLQGGGTFGVFMSVGTAIRC